jgi:hypothetical protein
VGAGIPFTPSVACDPDCTEIKLESGILLTFIKEECAAGPNSPSPGLWAIQFPDLELFAADDHPFARRESKPEG